MFNETQNKRIAQHAAAALVKAIDAFPDMLAESEAEQAASIVADVIKTQLTLPQPEPNPGSALAEVIRMATESAARESNSD